MLWAASPGASAAVVWNGPVITFAEGTPDPTQPTNQDRMTANVWITRGLIEGIFNAKTETNFTHFISPADTAWADGTLADYASLSYTNWDAWAKLIHTGPPSTVGVSAVVHLISDDIYLAIKFTFWGISGGLFTYKRTTPSTALPPIPLNIQRMGNQVVLSWTSAAFSLQSSTNDAAGHYSTITGATSPYTNNISNVPTFFRLSFN